MKASSVFRLVLLIAATLTAAIPTRGGELLHRGRRFEAAAWNTGYYDPAWGMPLAVVVPPTARWQSDYSWGVGGSRLSRVGARYQSQVSGPESAYDRRDYLPAPPQPSDTRQFGVGYASGPRR